MDVDGRGGGVGNFPAESIVGMAQWLATNRSSPQRTAIQERSDQSAAISVRAGAIYAATGAASVAGGPLVVFCCAAREALRFSGLGLSIRARDFHRAGRKIVLCAADLPGADGCGRRCVGSVFRRARPTLAGLGISRAAHQRRSGDVAIRHAAFAGGYFSALFAAAALREFGEDRA